MSLQLAAAAYIYIHYAEKKIQGKTAAMVAKATVLKQGSVKCFKFISTIELQSVNGLYKNVTRMSPTEFGYLIHLIGKRISKKIQRSGKPFLFKKGWH
jgi:hypothetical protein